MISVNFEIKPEEYAGAVRAHLSAAAWYTVILLTVVALWVICAVAWLAYPHAHLFRTGLLVMTGIGVFMVIDYWVVPMLKARYAIRSRLKQTFYYTFDEHGFTQRVGDREGEGSWRDVKKWGDTQGFYYLHLRANNNRRGGVALIPARVFSAEQKLELKGYLAAVK